MKEGEGGEKEEKKREKEREKKKRKEGSYQQSSLVKHSDLVEVWGPSLNLTRINNLKLGHRKFAWNFHKLMSFLRFHST